MIPLNIVGNSFPSNEQIGRACNHCRARKIRCDRTTPCGNCRAAGISCITSGSRPIQQRQRVLISNEYERKVDAIETRLVGIENLMASSNRLLHVLITKTSVATSTKFTKFTSTPSSTASVGVDCRNPLVGDTSLIAHSRHARQVLEDVLHSSHLVRSDPEVVLALSTLHTVMQKHQAATLNQPLGDLLHDTRTVNMDAMPPIEDILAILRAAQAADSLFFLIWTPFFTAEQFMEMCERLYYDFACCTLALKTIVFGCLHYMFIEYLSGSRTTYASPLWSYTATFLTNFELCLSQYRIFSEYNFETVLALVFSAGHAIQTSNFALAWASNSFASRLCQNLGWHRASDRESAETRPQQILFWVIYYIDKCLSLRLGRSSTIQDYDVTVVLPPEPVDPRFQAWNRWFRTLVEIGTLHGLVYEKLFSPGSFAISAEQRSISLQEIASRLDIVSEENSGIPTLTIYRRQYMSYLVKCNEVVIGCLLTLTHRAASASDGSDTFHLNDSCLKAARATIKGHQEILANIDGKHEGSANDYVNWTILNCPFTPFIVLFSHVVMSLDLSDLELLGDFVTSLDSHTLRSSESMKQFRLLSNAFYLLAKHFVSAMSRVTRNDRNAGHQSSFSNQSLHAGSTSDRERESQLDPDFTFLPSALFDDWLAGGQQFDYQWN